MKRLWDKARACRPSIYERPKAPLIERFAREHKIGVYNISSDAFVRFVSCVVGEAKPTKPIDILELHRCVAVAFGGLLGQTLVRVDHYGQASDIVLAGMLVLRDLSLRFGGDGESAIDLSFGANPGMDKDAIPFWRPELLEFSVSAIGSIFYRRGDRATQPREMRKEIRALLCSLYDQQFNSDTASTIQIEESILQSFYERCEKIRDAFNYPRFNNRLFAILGRDLESSFFVSGSDVISLSENKRDGLLLPMKELQSENHRAAVIAVYPWEADHLLKAEEMLARGIPVTEPLGRLFLGECEFALFEWVAGELLKRIQDPAVWEQYGQIVRQCHECGVALDDAAGRNAIWTGERVRVIDLEHTWLKKDREPLDDEERETSLTRIRKEGMWSAFERGYNSGS